MRALPRAKAFVTALDEETLLAVGPRRAIAVEARALEKLAELDRPLPPRNGADLARQRPTLAAQAPPRHRRSAGRAEGLAASLAEGSACLSRSRRCPVNRCDLSSDPFLVRVERKGAHRLGRRNGASGVAGGVSKPCGFQQHLMLPASA
jgi:hypothetical protein